MLLLGVGHVIRRSKLVGEWIREVVAATPNSWRVVTTVGTWCGIKFKKCRQPSPHTSGRCHPPPILPSSPATYTDTHRKNSMIEGNDVHESTSDSTELPPTSINPNLFHDFFGRRNRHMSGIPNLLLQPPVFSLS
ncbi:hypothetical protein PIB30_062048 [Stylosanthes scabra]|uniref:Uncharacterized protein n=1 Tax=Stylosanthes scabra TaxID=79078 RepID=A0ABU6RKZ3_9FABA|nr:hypothetical protein [Stylosanthes scabra]